MASCQEGHARAARGSARATRRVKIATKNGHRFILVPIIPSVVCLLQEPKNVRTELSRIVAPMAVDFPTGPGQRMSIFRCPIANRIMGIAQFLVWSPMGGRGSCSGRQARANHSVRAVEHLIDFHADLDIHHAIKIQRQVPARARHLQRFAKRPDFTAQLRHHLGQISLLCLAANHCCKLRRDLHELDVVLHCLAIVSVRLGQA